MPGTQSNLRERFNPQPQPLKAADIAQKLDLRLEGAGERLFKGLAPLGEAGIEQISFLDNPKYASQLKDTGAGAVIVRAEDADKVPAGAVKFITSQPYVAFARALALFYPLQKTGSSGIDDRANVSDNASIGDNVRIGPGAVVADGAEIGDNVVIGANTFIGRRVVVGAGTWIADSVTLRKCVVGRNCRIHSGVRVGQDGFGFAFDGQRVLKVPQIGGVRIGDDVEIGANSTIDCGAMGDTVIGNFCKLDNLVQIAHNVVLGDGCQLAAQSGVAGSTRLGRGVILGGQAGVAGHLEIADGVMVAGQSGVSKSITEVRSVWGGFPARPIKEWRRQQATLGRLTAKGKA